MPLPTRAVPPQISNRMRARHAAAGVDILVGRQVKEILGDGRATAVRLDDGTEIACDAVLVSIGAAPRVALAEAAGLAVDNGILVDATLRTSDPDIFAAGDVCAFDHGLFGARIRLGQMMIERGLDPDPAALADPAVNLKALMRQQAA